MEKIPPADLSRSLKDSYFPLLNGARTIQRVSFD